MGRKKTFDESAVLQTAMLLFWKNGYAATTFAKLETETGISGRSLIHSFGDKESLFSRSLEAYLAFVSSVIDAQFATPGIAAIIAFFRDIENAPADSPRNYGCLICNTIYENDLPPEPVTQAVETFRAKLLATFRKSLQADSIRLPAKRADFLLNHFWGNVTEIRRTGTTKTIAPSNTILTTLLQTWQATP